MCQYGIMKNMTRHQTKRDHDPGALDAVERLLPPDALGGGWMALIGVSREVGVFFYLASGMLTISITPQTM